MTKLFIIIFIAIIILLLISVLWYKNKENLCLCNGPQMKGKCKSYNLYSNNDVNINSPPKRKRPPELKMPYDVLQNGYQKTRPDCI